MGLVKDLSVVVDDGSIAEVFSLLCDISPTLRKLCISPVFDHMRDSERSASHEDLFNVNGFIRSDMVFASLTHLRITRGVVHRATALSSLVAAAPGLIHLDAAFECEVDAATREELLAPGYVAPTTATALRKLKLRFVGLSRGEIPSTFQHPGISLMARSPLLRQVSLSSDDREQPAPLQSAMALKDKAHLMDVDWSNTLADFLAVSRQVDLELPSLRRLIVKGEQYMSDPHLEMVSREASRN